MMPRVAGAATTEISAVRLMMIDDRKPCSRFDILLGYSPIAQLPRETRRTSGLGNSETRVESVVTLVEFENRHCSIVAGDSADGGAGPGEKWTGPVV